MARIVKIDRRDFLHLSALSGGSLILGAYLPGCGSGSPSDPDARSNSDAGPLPDGAAEPDATSPYYVMEPSVFLSIDSQGVVTVHVGRSEMGQGVRTSLPMVVAEELDADWTTIRAEGVIADSAYGDMSTGGSKSMRTWYDPLRSVGATARAMLITAAAQIWDVDVDTCATEPGAVVHSATDRRLGYGELVEVAKDLPVPTGVPLEDPSDFRIIGTSRDRLDGPAKVSGSAVFAGDVRLDGMMFAAVARPPAIGGSVTSFVSDAALAVPGVQQVVEVDTGVAVVADNTWAALRGREALEVNFAGGPNADLDDAALQAILDAKQLETPQQASLIGDPATALDGAAVRLDQVYQVPFLAHAPMEPTCCVAHAETDHCEVWAPTQDPMAARNAVASLLGISRTNVDVHTTLLGGGFGNGFRTDFVIEAAQVSQAVAAPIQVIRTRADDLRHDYYRPFSRHLVSGGLDAENNLVGLSHTVVAPSIRSQFGGVDTGLDWGAVDSLYNTLYSVPNYYVGYVKANTPVPICWWRSVYQSQNPFATECFLDELAIAAGRDPVEFRTAMLTGAPRLAAVITRAATEAGWPASLPSGQGQGIACTSAYDSFIAMVARVTVDGDGKVKVDKVDCAVDCGRVVNPDGVVAQMESGIAFGLSAALYGEISLTGGGVQQHSFFDYRIVKFGEMPQVAVHVIDSTAAVGGVGELGVPPIGPAVANAIYAATGTRIRTLPIGQLT